MVGFRMAGAGSHLDGWSERVIADAVRRLWITRTTIAHRKEPWA